MRYPDCNGLVYVIQPGDTLYNISRRFNIPLAYILRANSDIDIYNLYVGLQICIPYTNPYVSTVPVLPWPGVDPPPMPQGPGPVRPPRPEPPRPEPARPPRPQGPGPVIPPRPEPARPPRPQEPGPMRLQEQQSSDRRSIADDYNAGTYVIINYVVKNEETIQDILRRFGLNLSDVVRFNQLDQIILKPGTVLKVPNTNVMDEQKYEIDKR